MFLSFFSNRVTKKGSECLLKPREMTANPILDSGKNVNGLLNVMSGTNFSSNVGLLLKISPVIVQALFQIII